MNNKKTILTLALIAAGVVSPVYAQTVVPDAGRLNRELQERPPQAPRAPSVNIEVPQAAPETVQPGGLKVTLTEVRFEGNTVFDQTRLAGELRARLGQPYDLAGFYELAEQASTFYRAQGYAFATVFVPKDGYRDGVLTLQVVEGSYGERRVQADDANHAASAQRFLNKLEPGTPIEAARLERAMLLLEDQPGYDVTPVIKPGAVLGTGDLDVQLTRTPLVSGNLSVSNHGNRYTGYLQARATVFLNSLFQFGDQVSVSALQSDKDLTYGAAQYSMPLGGNGLRGNVGYSITDYELGREFTNLQASGDAEILSAGLSYPWLRTRSSNISTSLLFQKKEFFDQQLAVNSNISRSSDSTSVALNFDHLDAKGITYGQVEWTRGDFNGPVPDPARTNGNFSRINYDVVRQQSLSQRIGLYARINGQLANDNLDSSESYSLGGPFAVRAYPTGEATGDEGMLGQIELRYRYSDRISPFVFYDIGQVKFENTPTAPGNNERTLSGAGVGMRYQDGPMSLELLAASRGTGGRAQSDPSAGSVTTWLVMRYAF